MSVAPAPIYLTDYFGPYMFEAQEVQGEVYVPHIRGIHASLSAVTEEMADEILQEINLS